MPEMLKAKVSNRVVVEIPSQTRLLDVENERRIENYPLPRVAHQRIVASICYEGEAVSANVGISGNRFYRKENYKAYRDALAWLIRERLGDDWGTRRYSFGVRVRFFLSGRKKIDIDNLIKPILDAGTNLVWADDSQVVEVYARILQNQAKPRIEALIYHFGDWVDYHRYCEYCGKELTGKGLLRRFCSVECQNSAQRKGVDLTCANCGKVFHKGRLLGTRKLANRFCSRACWREWMKTHGRDAKGRFTSEVPGGKS